MTADEQKGSSRPARKIQRSATLPEELVNRARSAVYWTRNVPGEPGSYSELTERGIRAEVERLERVYNGGEPFEPGELRPGPAPGVMKRVAEMRRLRAQEEAAQVEGEPGGESGEGLG